jgi:hypothetical protein
MKPDADVMGEYNKSRFPNVWLCRLVILTMDYDQKELLDNLNELSPEAFSDRWHLRFVTCDFPPVRRVEPIKDGEFEPTEYEEESSEWY